MVTAHAKAGPPRFVPLQDRRDEMIVRHDTAAKACDVEPSMFDPSGAHTGAERAKPAEAGPNDFQIGRHLAADLLGRGQQSADAGEWIHLCRLTEIIHVSIARRCEPWAGGGQVEDADAFAVELPHQFFHFGQVDLHRSCRQRPCPG